MVRGLECRIWNLCSFMITQRRDRPMRRMLTIVILVSIAGLALLAGYS